MATKRSKSLTSGPQRRGLFAALTLMSVIIFVGVYLIDKNSKSAVPMRILPDMQTPGLFNMGVNDEEPAATETEKMSHGDWVTMNHQKKGALVGTPTFLTGDLLVVNGQKFRLWGIDAIDEFQLCQANAHDWPCGTTPIQALQMYTEGGLIACYERGTNRSGERVAQCFRGDIDLNGLLAENGLAYAIRNETTNYHLKEGMGKSRKAGIWNKR